MKKRILFVARYYPIEPLGIHYLAGTARDEGWERKVVLVKDFDFEPVYEAIRSWKPDLVGIQIWTGFHMLAFQGCDHMRAMGVPVVIGGPHATYFDQECALHADFVLRGHGFKKFTELLQGNLPRGVHFDPHGRSDPLPLPDRNAVYEPYPELAISPIKSMLASEGCPFKCTYCYAPAFNRLHGGFKLILGEIDRLIIEAQELKERWPLSMIYFQDDIFGFDYKKWLPEFSRRWRDEVGVPFHCQVRLELVEGLAGDRRLDLFAEAGCTGITLAIESGNDFLREQVLFRGMSDELILEGCRKIMSRGMTLRTEQILAVPFSDTATDLSTLRLNNRINPTMVWTSILAPYMGTEMGTITTNFGLYRRNNDDLSETFFDRSVLRHIVGGPRDMERIVQNLEGSKTQALLKMKVSGDGHVVDVVHAKAGKVGTLEYLDEASNEQYCVDTVRLQRLFIPLAKMPGAEVLGAKMVALPNGDWSWRKIGEVTTDHLSETVSESKLQDGLHMLAREMHLSSPDLLPDPIRQNPHYFTYFAAGGKLARQVVDQGVFDPAHTTGETLDKLNTLTRRHLFTFGLYKIEKGADPIAA